MGKLAERLRAFSRNRWLVFVAAMWLQYMAGVGYLFGAISSVLKAALGYNQRQVAALGVAKNLGSCVGLVAGMLSATLPAWALVLIGAAHNFVGYGWVWLIVPGKAPPLPLWMKAALAKQLNLRPRQVEVWFQNRRARSIVWPVFTRRMLSLINLEALITSLAGIARLIMFLWFRRL